ncbi:MAG: acyl-CoA dehydrogenase family protein [Dehalococcoidales bacterium]
MNFGFTEEQELLRDQVRRFMQNQLPITKVREIMKTESGFDAEIWRQMAELGWLGLLIPEDLGGVGLKWVDLVVILEETGRGLSPMPLISQYLSSAALLRCGGDKLKHWLPKLAEGSTLATLALFDESSLVGSDGVTLRVEGNTLNGRKPFAPDAGAANLFLIAVRTGAGLALAAVEKDAPGVSVSLEAMMDETKRVGTVFFKDVDVGDSLMPLSEEDLAYLVDCGAVAVTAEMVGGAEAAMQMTTNYANERVQFGALIGKYQGVKHRLADIYVDVESFKSLVYYAAWTVDDAVDELPRAASLAKGYASDAFVRIGIESVGLHGAIGYTAEYDIQLYLKRSKWARPMFGDSDFHYERVAALGGL